MTVRIHKNALLYRAAPTVEEHPTPRVCSDTDKIGVYFAIGSPMLSETMAYEYQQDMIVSVYELVQDIDVSYGKYSYIDLNPSKYPKGYGSCRPEDNISHFDDNIQPVYPIRGQFPESCELFLIEKDLKWVRFKGCYEYSLNKCIQDYY